MKKKWYQVHDSLTGCYLPDSVSVHRSKKDALDTLAYARDLYKECGAKVDGRRADGRYYVLMNEGFRTVQRVIEVHGPLTAFDMGYESDAQVEEAEFA